MARTGPGGLIYVNRTGQYKGGRLNRIPPGG